MGRLHGRNARLHLKDADGNDTEIAIGDWVIEFGKYPSTPRMEFAVADYDPEKTEPK